MADEYKKLEEQRRILLGCALEPEGDLSSRAKDLAERLGLDVNFNGLDDPRNQAHPNDYRTKLLEALNSKTALQKAEPQNLVVGNINDLSDLVEPLEKSAIWMYELLSPLVGKGEYFQYSDPEEYFSDLKGSFGVYGGDSTLSFGHCEKRNTWPSKNNKLYGIIFRVKRKNKLFRKGHKLNVKIGEWHMETQIKTVEKFINNIKKEIDNESENAYLRLEYLEHLLYFPKIVPAFVEEIKVAKLNGQLTQFQQSIKEWMERIRRSASELPASETDS